MANTDDKSGFSEVVFRTIYDAGEPTYMEIARKTGKPEKLPLALQSLIETGYVEIIHHSGEIHNPDYYIVTDIGLKKFGLFTA